MNLPLRALEIHVPAWVSRTAIHRMLAATGSAFGRSSDDVRGLDRRALLDRYIAFTVECADEAVNAGADLDAITRRLRRNAYALGRVLRRRLRIRTRDSALRAVRVAYAMIGIELRADRSGTVVVDRCPFAAAYSPRTCRLMSSLDAGLVAGLTDGGRLAFSERITEGRGRCLGHITWTEAAA